MKRIGFHTPTKQVPAILELLALLGLLTVSICEAADRIVLRNLKTITDRTVAAFDPDGVRLDDGTVISWDEIEKAKVSAEKQADFDQLLSELGTHLYRLRQRLSVGDYRGLLAHAEALYPRYVHRDSQTAYAVFQSTMWSRLAIGQRERALEPYLRCCEYLRRHTAGGVSLPGERRLVCDLKTGLCPELPPVWFDARVAKTVLPEVFKTIGGMQQPRPAGVYVYFATLALTAGEAELADRVLSAASFDAPPLQELRTIVLAQREITLGQSGVSVQQLNNRLGQFSATHKPLALYWAGLEKVHSAPSEIRQQGLLQLLRIPAAFGADQPELAGAAIFASSQALAELDDPRGSVSLRKELLEKYPQTHFATRLESPPKAEDNGGIEEKP